MTTKAKTTPEAPETETPVTVENVPTGLAVTTNFVVDDNTNAVPVEETPVATEEYELLAGLVQTNYL